jgi:hypothetical protein
MTDLRREFLELDDEESTGRSCPDPERLWQAVAGRLGQEERTEILEHTASCGACAQAWRLAYSLGAADQVRQSGVPASWRRWSVWGAAAAAVLVLVFGFELAERESRAPTFRRPAVAVIESRIADQKTLPRDGAVLRWDGPEEAFYRLRVMTADLMPLTEARELEAEEYQVPASVLSGVPPGSRIVWQVEARLPDGRRVTSPAFHVEVN